jgi:hypothetical protein
MLIETSNFRYGGDPDPDEERERRWEPVSRREFLPMAGSVSCFIVSVVTTGVVFFLLNVVAVGLFLCFVRASWPGRGGPSAPGPRRARRD